MKSEERRPGSLKWGLTLATLLCWILPIIIVTAVAAASLNYYYDRTIKQTADAGAENAMRQVELRLASAIKDSKAVSYEGIVHQAYRDYQHTHDRVGVYRTVTEYLSQKPSKMDEIDEALAAMTQKLEQLPPDEAGGASGREFHRQSGHRVHRAALPREAVAAGGRRLLLYLSVAPVKVAE